ncbi:sporulation membrane protein YtrI [Bacillus alveayuensis]|jgi:cell division protein FtsB|uniref:sporulation membrane protein YtrI n=1 Tax=Aeribacillus alveayuensis TaxID=279215 RepID=UPI0005D10703|nr:sporulation membrane protein YtrI [Bacillus alveayuensis]
MRIPPYYQKPSWQRFFVGMVFGAMISWGFFLYSYSVLQEKNVEIMTKQKDTIKQLRKENEIWKEDIQKLNDQNEKLLTVQNIKVNIKNAERYKLDKIMEYLIKKHVEEDLSDLKAKNIESVINTRHLITKAIENEEFKVEDKEYKAKVSQLVISTTIIVEIEIVSVK